MGNIGKVVQIVGPVVDCEFPEKHRLRGGLGHSHGPENQARACRRPPR